MPIAHEFVTTVGNRKMLGLVYRALMDAGMAPTAREWYKEAEFGYHPIAKLVLEKIVFPRRSADELVDNSLFVMLV